MKMIELVQSFQRLIEYYSFYIDFDIVIFFFFDSIDKRHNDRWYENGLINLFLFIVLLHFVLL